MGIRGAVVGGGSVGGLVFLRKEAENVVVG